MLSKTAPSPASGHPALEATSILHTAVGLSGERNIDDIRISLARTIFELFAVQEMICYRPSGSRSEPRLDEILRARPAAPGDDPDLRITELNARGLKPPPELQRCLTNLQTTEIPGEDGRRRVCFPVASNGKLLELVVVELPVTAESPPNQVFGGLLRLYANIVDLIHDKELDTLTGLLNRRAFDAHLGALMQRPGLNDSAAGWWLVMLDVDHFKPINDQFGHLIGDEVLLLLGQMLRQSFRQTDRAYRYGGEEFALLLSPADDETARAAVERFRRLVAEHVFPQVGRITISAGMVRVDHYDHVSSVIGRADRALYEAKRSGRNQVCEFAELVASGALPAESVGHDVELF